MWTLIIIKTLIFLCCFDFAKTNFRDNHDIIFLNLGKIYINPKSIKVFKNIPIKPLRQTINNLQILLQTYRFLNFPFDRNIEFLKIKNNLTFFKNKQSISENFAANFCKNISSTLPIISNKNQFHGILEIMDQNDTVFSHFSENYENFSKSFKKYRHLICIETPNIFRNCGRFFGKDPYTIIYKKQDTMVKLIFYNKQLFQKSVFIKSIICSGDGSNFKFWNDKFQKFQKLSSDVNQMIERIENIFPENFSKFKKKIKIKRSVFSVISGGVVGFITSYLVNEEKFSKLRSDIELNHKNLELLLENQSNLEKSISELSENIKKSLQTSNENFKILSRKLQIIKIEQMIIYLIANLKEFDFMLRDIILEATRGKISAHLIDFKSLKKEVLLKNESVDFSNSFNFDLICSKNNFLITFQLPLISEKLLHNVFELKAYPFFHNKFVMKNK